MGKKSKPAQDSDARDAQGDQEVGRPLTLQQERYCQEFLKDLNQTHAAIRADYGKKNAHSVASRLMDDPRIVKKIQALMDRRAERTGITTDYVLEKIQETVERCSQGEPHMEWDPDAKCMVPSGEWTFEHMGVLKGCELLGKHLKLFTEKHEHSGPNGGPIALTALTDEQLDAKLRALSAPKEIT